MKPEVALSRNRDPFRQALESLRAGLSSGRYAPGAPIVIVDEAGRLRLSPTPVREALAWLGGEGLVERAETGGYLAARLGPSDVSDLYGFRALALRACFDILAPRRSPALPPASSKAAEPAALFADLAKATGSGVLSRAVDRVNLRLASVEAVEAAVFQDLPAERDALSAALGAENVAELAQAVARHHERRIAAAPLLSVAANKPRPPQDGGS